MTSLRLAAAALLCACAGQLNPSVPVPQQGRVSPVPGVWVAYNLGCDVGCEVIKRGDIITAIDGVPVTSGAEVDAADLARGTPVRLRVLKRDENQELEVDIVARPNEYLPPLEHVPPLWTVGVDALDRAPAHARLKGFGQAIPAMRLWRIDTPRMYVTGRQLHGRGAFLVLWYTNAVVQQEARRYHALLPDIYARLQARDAELQAIGVDSLFVFPGKVDPRYRQYTRVKAAEKQGGGKVVPMVPLFADITSERDPNALGLQNQAADLDEIRGLNQGRGPVILVIDPRGIIRWHTQGFDPEDPGRTVDDAIEFALTQLHDQPRAAPPAASAPAPASPPDVVTQPPAATAPTPAAETLPPPLTPPG